MDTDTMISKQEVYRIRIKPFIDRQIADDAIYLDKFNRDGWLDYLVNVMKKFPVEQFITIADDDLKRRIGRLMSHQLVAGMLNDFTPEQMKIFDECMVRR
jgi:hypothetical protein